VESKRGFVSHIPQSHGRSKNRILKLNVGEPSGEISNRTPPFVSKDLSELRELRVEDGLFDVGAERLEGGIFEDDGEDLFAKPMGGPERHHRPEGMPHEDQWAMNHLTGDVNCIVDVLQNSVLLRGSGGLTVAAKIQPPGGVARCQSGHH
jgi:hypothetical protein